MVQLKENSLIITAECKDPLESLNQLRKAIAVVTTVLVESDEFYYNKHLPEAISNLIQLQEQLCTEKDI